MDQYVNTIGIMLLMYEKIHDLYSPINLPSYVCKICC